MYAPLGEASRHCFDGQDRGVMPERDRQSKRSADLFCRSAALGPCR
jgi:hypothetical protein